MTNIRYVLTQYHSMSYSNVRLSFVDLRWAQLYVSLVILVFLRRRWCDAYDVFLYDRKNTNLFADIWEHSCSGLHFRRRRFLKTLKIIFPPFYVVVIISLAEENSNTRFHYEEKKSFYNMFTGERQYSVPRLRWCIFENNSDLAKDFKQREFMPIAHCLLPIAYWQYQD